MAKNKIDNQDEKELQKALSNNRPNVKKKKEVKDSPMVATSPNVPIDEKKYTGKMTQWASTDGERFFPAGDVEQQIPAGIYDIQENPNVGIYFSKIKQDTNSLLRFPDSKQDRILKEIDTFWTRKEAFKNRPGRGSITYKRGIILWGPAGSGKSSLLKLIVNDVISRDGVCIVFSHPKLFANGMRLFRQIHPDKKVVVLMEDIDSILDNYDESEVLNVLDGVNGFEDIVFLATTNYPERLGDRIINRPSRFDKRFFINHPNKESRKMYLESLLTEGEIKENKININQWVKDTEDFSMAHMKELVVATVILGDSYERALATLQAMKEKPTSESSGKGMGFTNEEQDGEERD
jgi:hypothetical protein